MGGGLMQLVAYGAQDVYLTGNPQITFWKVTYRRHTNFAMESIEQTFNGQADFGRRVTCTVSRNGDLAYRTYLQVTLPEINSSMASYARWLDFPGHQLVEDVEVEIGGQRIEKHYGDWMHIWCQLTLDKNQEKGYYKMVGNTTQLTFVTDPSFADVDGPCDSDAPRQVCAPRNALPETTLYVPLQFWFCSNPGLALPLIALQYHEVKINLDLRAIDECLWAVSSLTTSSGELKASTAYGQSLVSASLYVDYIYLDTDERRRMAQNLMSTSLSNSNTLALNLLVLPPTRSALTSTTLLRNSYGLYNLTATLTTAPPPKADKYSTALSVLNLSTTLMLLMLSLTPSRHSVDLNLLLARKPSSPAACSNPMLLSMLPALLAPQLAPLYLMLEPSLWLRPPSTCTAGVRTLLLPLSSNLTAKTASLSVKAPTSTKYNPSNTTAALLTPVSTYTPSLSALKSTNLPAPATCPASTTLPSNSYSPTLPYLAPPPLRYAYTLATTTYSASCPAWVASHTPTKLVRCM